MYGIPICGYCGPSLVTIVLASTRKLSNLGTAMETFTRPSTRKATTIILFMLVVLPFTASSQTLKTVLIKGQVIVSDQVTTPVDLTMDVGEHSCDQVMLFGRGKFEIEARDGERYEFRFEQAGSVPKTVTIDTKNVEKKVGEKKRVVEFDVVLAPLDTVKPLHYAQPVGKINFHKSNGRSLVERNRQMVATGQEPLQK